MTGDGSYRIHLTTEGGAAGVLGGRHGGEARRYGR
jgi:hypothetical protein